MITNLYHAMLPVNGYAHYFQTDQRLLCVISYPVFKKKKTIDFWIIKHYQWCFYSKCEIVF